MSHPSLDEQATDWLIRRDRNFTPAEQDEYLQWLAADPRHGDALARQQATWRELDLLADWRPEHASEPNPALLALPRRAVRRSWHWFVPAALVAAFLVFAIVRNHATRPTPAAPPVVATGYEERLLEDGSVLELNRGASVVVSYTLNERRVRLLSGEAYFRVAKNPSRPFIVNAAGIETRAIGTSFNVCLASTTVEVLVTEGRVQIASTSETTTTPNPTVSGGEKIVVPLVAHHEGNSPLLAIVPVAVSAEEIAHTLAWQPRRLEFSAEPLARVVAEFNRHNTIQLALADPVLASFPVTASFRSNNAEGFVRLLEATAGIRAERHGDTIFLGRANSP